MGHVERLERIRRKVLAAEVGAVLLATFGASALYSVLNLVDLGLAHGGIGAQQVTLNAPAFRAVALDIARDVVDSAHLTAFAALALVLLARDRLVPRAFRPDTPELLGLRPNVRDVASGAGLAALIGVPGLMLYLLAHHLRLAPTVAPALGYPAWRAPELVLLAFANGFAEEVLVVGYLVTRLRQLGAAPIAALAASALLRGCYHLYQGPAAGLGNIAMGLVFGWVWMSGRRIAPLVLAHTLIDSAAFVAYPLLRGHLAWLP